MSRFAVQQPCSPWRDANCINRPGKRAVYTMPLYNPEQEAKDAAMAAASAKDQ